jgi:hypothetical protein
LVFLSDMSDMSIQKSLKSSKMALLLNRQHIPDSR